MPERLQVKTIKRSGWRGLADFYVTTIYDQTNDIMATCAGDTPADSEANAKAYLAMLIARKVPHQEKKRDMDRASRAKEVAR
jgi:hypothetical protein